VTVDPSTSGLLEPLPAAGHGCQTGCAISPGEHCLTYEGGPHNEFNVRGRPTSALITVGVCSAERRGDWRTELCTAQDGARQAKEILWIPWSGLAGRTG
jgi:hypothetical protein